MAASSIVFNMELLKVDLEQRNAVVLDRRWHDIGPLPELGERRTRSGRRATDAMKMACPFCGFAQSKPCDTCNQPTPVYGSYCKACGKKQ